MGLIYKELEFAGIRGSQTLQALMDTGASYSFLRGAEGRAIGDPFKTVKPLEFEVGEGTVTVEEAVAALVRLDRYEIHWVFYLLDNLTEAAIIGTDFFQRWKIRLDPASEELIVDPQALKLKLV